MQKNPPVFRHNFRTPPGIPPDVTPGGGAVTLRCWRFWPGRGTIGASRKEVIHRTFGEKLLKLRKEGGLSQEGLAEKLSVSRQAVSRWENEGILPDCVNLLEISRLFGGSTDYLLHDDYQSDGDLPAVRTARDQLAGEKERQGVLLLLAGLHAVFLLLADLAARTLVAPIELPIGVVTSLVGAVVFIVIFYKAGKG